MLTPFPGRKGSDTIKETCSKVWGRQGGLDWEEGPEGWVFTYSESAGRQEFPGVLLEPINHVILGVHPA